ncbi:MAG: PH domain-containing protein [Nitriliruptoraceae bacterium]
MSATPSGTGPSSPTPPPPPVGAGRGGAATANVDDHLPRPGLDDRDRELAPAIVTAWRISAALGWLLPGLVSVVLGFVLAGDWGWLVLGAVVALVVFSVVFYPGLRYRRWRWQLTELAIELRYGVLVRTQETVPYFRIQQIDITAGPVDRLLGLASLQVTSASASGSATLPGIAADQAPQVRAELLARAAAAVGEHPGDLRDAV